jgi:hypothetical protein
MAPETNPRVYALTKSSKCICVLFARRRLRLDTFRGGVRFGGLYGRIQSGPGMPGTPGLIEADPLSEKSA